MNLDKLCGFETMCFRLKDRSYDFSDGAGGGGAVGGVVGGSSNAREISLGDDFGDVVVSANGARVEISHDGVVTTKCGPANETAAKPKTALQIGDLDDGGIYVGLSAEDGQPLHAALKDLPEYKTYEEALAAAEQLKSLHPTAHVPTPNELKFNLFDRRNAGHLKDTFNTSGSFPASCYLSSASCCDYGARVQYFDDSGQLDYIRNGRLPVRLVW
jgi:hypothetical protein